MLSAHRDQENLVQNRGAPPKQQQAKTPGIKLAKTPLHARFDENVPVTIGPAKAPVELGGRKTLTSNQLTVAAKKHATTTPLDYQKRAPLGDKTTNGRAVTLRANLAKSVVKDIEQTQTKHTTIGPRQRRKAVDFLSTAQPSKQSDASDFSESIEEPEYGPPAPDPLPYESDVLPKGGLTFEGLKRENLFRGFYDYFYRDVDEHGKTRQDRKFDEEMQAVLKKAEEQNDRDLAELTWNPLDLSDNRDVKQQGPSQHRVARPQQGTQSARDRHGAPGTVRSRAAASALAGPSLNSKPLAAKSRPQSVKAPPRKPLSNYLSGKKTPRFTGHSETPSVASSAGEAASRTTIGYNRGRVASSLVRGRHETTSQQRSILGSPDQKRIDGIPEITKSSRPQTPSKQAPSLGFLALFDDTDDEEDLPPLRAPFSDSDIDDEEFELKLVI